MPTTTKSLTSHRPTRKSSAGVQPRMLTLIRELRFLVDTTHALALAREPKSVRCIIFDKAKTMVRCEAWSLFLVDASTQELIFDMVGGPKARRLKGQRIKPGQGIAGWVAQSGKPAMVADTGKDRRFLAEIDRANKFVTRTVLCVPIFSKKRPVAVLEMVNKIGKPFDRQDLRLLTRLSEQASIALERATLHEQAVTLGVIDELTKLYNVHYLEQALDREVRRCRRYGSIMALIFMDLDRFKAINDRCGHMLGSQCLAEVAQIMAARVRDVDILARYGGDEFVVILPETTVATAKMVAERLHSGVGTHVFLKNAGINVHLSTSIGIAGFPDHAKTKEDLVRKADEAMYRAKSGGRNRLCIADQP
ncbi:MAG: sensor domain-containing diguanylate cyclase [Nitrospirae bacterium]|nr:sensor domain-containing diguanylate cyclase [Nitrospirota bacterium]